MIPDFEENGNLPPGIYVVNIEEVVKRFGGSKSLVRSHLTKSLRTFYNFIKFQPCEVYINGSYTTNKLSPTDIDILVIRSPDFRNNIDAMIRLGHFKKHSKDYGLHIQSPVKSIDDDEIDFFWDWFQHDRDKNAKGIIRLR